MRKFLVVVALAALAVFAPVSKGQLVATGSLNVNVNVTQQSVIQVSESGGLNFDPSSGISNSISFNVKWNIGPVNSVRMYTYFQSASAALSSSGGSTIPSSAITSTFGSPDQSGSGQACNQAPGVGNGVVDGAACQTILVGSVGGGDVGNGGPNNNFPSGGANVTLNLAISNYASLKLPAGSYSGTLSAVVVAI